MSEATESTARPPQPRGDRTLTWWPLVGAAVLAAIVLTVIFTSGAGDDNRVGSKTDDNGALECPAEYKLRTDSFWVPLEPSGVDGKARTVPNVKPGHVTVCRYTAPPSSRGSGDVALDGTRVLSSGLATMTQRLSKAPEAPEGTRAGKVGPGGEIYLVGATFATGYVWISAPVKAGSNGQFVTSADVHLAAEQAFDTGAWPKG
ncbi:hypothetical protein [Jatrophihabitans fulvus]